ncbi:WD40-repeat-containing domain protein [Kalaharituber pfeilii]|nr:WD40-repeat-containing domain protein [Kalaharituber pfeilii]
MKVTYQNGVSIYTVSGSSTSRSLPDWLIRKRKRSLKNDVEFQNRIELIQDFEFEEASQCIRVSRDGEYAMATGTYKPQHHTYHLPSLALKYARHHVSLNLTFLLLSSDYTKSVHLQTDRTLEFHTPMGCHYSIRIPRYGRALGYQQQRAEVVVPADGNEVYRLDLEAGRFLKPFELEPDVKSGESIAIESNCHGLLAFGTDKGTVEFWDPRSRHRIGILSPPAGAAGSMGSLFSSDPTIISGDVEQKKPGITALDFHSNGLTLATGSSVGITTLFDIRSPHPLLIKDQQYGFPIQTLKFLKLAHDTSVPKVLSSDKRIIKIWDQESGKPWTAMEPFVDINHVEPVPDSGMIFTANEGQEMHSFFIPQLGPAPKWCSFLDNLTEEMADAHLNDPNAYKRSDGSGVAGTSIATYDNYKFLTKADLVTLGLDALVGTPKGNSILRPYMHGYFIDQRLYEELRLVADPFEWERERTKMIRERIEKERESRIRSSKKDAIKVKVNKNLAERLMRQEEKLLKRQERGKNMKEEVKPDGETKEDEGVIGKVSALLKDKRFGNLFEDPEFAIDETSAEYQHLHPSSAGRSGAAGGAVDTPSERKKGRTAAESEEDMSSDHSSSSLSDSDGSISESGSESRSRKQIQNKNSRQLEKREPEMRISTAEYRKSGHSTRGFGPANNRKRKLPSEQTFGARVGRGGEVRRVGAKRSGEVLGEREITFMTSRKKNIYSAREGKKAVDMSKGGGDRSSRRSASGNVMRTLGR